MVNQYLPHNLNEALDILNKEDCYILAGGTDLMVQKRNTSNALPLFDKAILYTNHLDELAYVKEDEKGVHVGSNMKIVDLENHPAIPRMLQDVLKELASPQIRNIATMTGNVCNASPAGDSIVPLYVLDARVVLVSVNGERSVKISEFITGVRRTVRQSNELVKEIFIPYNHATRTYWKKVGSRKAETISKVSMAGLYEIKDHKLVDLRIAFGSVGATIKRSNDIEEKFIGLDIDDISVTDVVNEYSLLITPIDDQRSTSKYRFIVALNILKDFLSRLKAGECDK